MALVLSNSGNMPVAIKQDMSVQQMVNKLEAYEKIINMNKVTKRRKNLYLSFQNLDNAKKSEIAKEKKRGYFSRFLQIFKKNPINVKVINKYSNMSETTNRKDLKSLVDSNILESRKNGRSYNYELKQTNMKNFDKKVLELTL